MSNLEVCLLTLIFSFLLYAQLVHNSSFLVDKKATQKSKMIILDDGTVWEMKEHKDDK